MTAEVNAAYTLDDHSLREFDRYALAKYRITMRWLGSRLRPGATVYNIGLGSGYFNHLVVRSGARVVGCEPDAQAFAAANASKPAENCELVRADLQTFARDRAPADIVVMHDVLEHIEDDAAAARDLAQLVSNTGSIVLSVPALPALFGKHDVELGHFRRYTKASLVAVLAPHFRIRRIQYFGMASIPIVLYFSVWRRSSYPRAAASDSMLARAYGLVCNLESYVPEPIGTSIVVHLEPLRRS